MVRLVPSKLYSFVYSLLLPCYLALPRVIVSRHGSQTHWRPAALGWGGGVLGTSVSRPWRSCPPSTLLLLLVGCPLVLSLPLRLEERKAPSGSPSTSSHKSSEDNEFLWGLV